MSHEFNLIEQPEVEYPLFPIEQPIFEIETPVSISQSAFFYIPDEPPFLRENFKGLQFEGVQYTWDEFDYRLQVEYNGVPEPADAGLVMGIILGLILLYKMFMKKGTTQMKCSICKTKDSIVSFIKSIYNKITGGK